MQGTSSMAVNEEDDIILDLPPGFRFHPTDEEIITHYLTKKVINERFTAIAIGQVDMNKCEPWDLPKKGKMKEKEWFFFCQRDRKYPTGMRTNRATGTGYWKATGKDREIYKGKNWLVGMKKTLVFYKGRAPKGEKTNWVMHEYRLEGKIPYYNFPRGAKDEWVVCKIFHKNTGIRRYLFGEISRNDSFIQEIIQSPSLTPLMDDNKPTNSSLNTNEEEDEFKYQNSSLQIQEPENGFFVPTYPINAFKGSYNYQNQEQYPNYFNNYQFQECQNSSSNRISMISPASQDITEISSHRGFEDLEGISVNPNMSDLENLWDY